MPCSCSEVEKDHDINVKQEPPESWEADPECSATWKARQEHVAEGGEVNSLRHSPEFTEGMADGDIVFVFNSNELVGGFNSFSGVRVARNQISRV